MRVPSSFAATLLAATVALPDVALSAATQSMRPIPEVRTRVGASGAYAPGSIPVAVEVLLPSGFHAQSNETRDPLLIPTHLAVTPPARIRAGDVVYPEAVEFTQAANREPLVVFKEQFVVGVMLTILPGAAVETTVVPAHLTYQVCDRSRCFPPTSEVISWTVPIVPRTEVIRRQFRPLFDRIGFGKMR